VRRSFEDLERRRLERPDPQIECVNRVVQIVPFTSLDQVYPHVPRNVQTVVMQLPVELAEEFSESAARLGVCRLPRPGEGNHFENPWDGVGLVSRLTRAVVRSEAGT
jgi:hypothetical protein